MSFPEISSFRQNDASNSLQPMAFSAQSGMRSLGQFSGMTFYRKKPAEYEYGHMCVRVAATLADSLHHHQHYETRLLSRATFHRSL